MTYITLVKKSYNLRYYRVQYEEIRTVSECITSKVCVFNNIFAATLDGNVVLLQMFEFYEVFFL
jgi:hypothetical protein